LADGDLGMLVADACPVLVVQGGCQDDR